jgi:hypothetical protein
MESGSDRRPLVIIPCFNEERSLPALLDELDTLAPDLDRVVVDDGSSDGTAAVADGRAVVLTLAANLGIGGAVQTGIRWAAERGYPCCVQLDGDGQHPPAAIGALVEAQRRTGADLVIGSRFLQDGEGFRSTAARRLGIGLIAFALRLLFGVRVTDPTSGLRLLGPAAIAAFAARYPLDFPEPVSIGMAVAPWPELDRRDRVVPLYAAGDRQPGAGPDRRLSPLEYHPTQATIVFVAVFTLVYLGVLVRNAARHVIDLYDLAGLSMPALLPALLVAFPGPAAGLARLVGVSFTFLLLFGALFVVAFVLLYRLTVLVHRLETRQAGLVQELAILGARVREAGEKGLGRDPQGPPPVLAVETEPGRQ